MKTNSCLERHFCGRMDPSLAYQTEQCVTSKPSFLLSLRLLCSSPPSLMFFCSNACMVASPLVPPSPNMYLYFISPSLHMLIHRTAFSRLSPHEREQEVHEERRLLEAIRHELQAHLAQLQHEEQDLRAISSPVRLNSDGVPYCFSRQRPCLLINSRASAASSSIDEAYMVLKERLSVALDARDCASARASAALLAA